MSEPEEEEIVVTEEALKYARETTDQLTVFVLKDMVVALNETKLKLLLNIKELKQQLNQQKEDQADIYFYLNKKCDDAYEIIATLEEQLLNEQTDREIAEKAYEKKISELQTFCETTEIRSQTRVRDMEDKMQMAKEFSLKKEENEILLSNLMNTLESERAQFARNVDEMENRLFVEREKMKKEFESKLVAAKKDMHSHVHEKLSKVTRKTQAMNNQLSSELKNQSTEASKVLDISYKIEGRDRDIRREFELLKDSETEMLNRLSAYQRIIKQQNFKISKEEEEFTQMADNLRNQLETKDIMIEELQRKLRSMEPNTGGDISKLDEAWVFLSKKLEVLKAGGSKKRRGKSIASLKSKTNFENPSDAIIVELIETLCEKYPERFGSIQDTSQNLGMGTLSIDESFVDSISERFLPAVSSLTMPGDIQSIPELSQKSADESYTIIRMDTSELATQTDATLVNSTILIKLTPKKAPPRDESVKFEGFRRNYGTRTVIDDESFSIQTDPVYNQNINGSVESLDDVSHHSVKSANFAQSSSNKQLINASYSTRNNNNNNNSNSKRRKDKAALKQSALTYDQHRNISPSEQIRPKIVMSVRPQIYPNSKEIIQKARMEEKLRQSNILSSMSIAGQSFNSQIGSASNSLSLDDSKSAVGLRQGNESSPMNKHNVFVPEHRKLRLSGFADLSRDRRDDEDMPTSPNSSVTMSPRLADFHL